MPAFLLIAACCAAPAAAGAILFFKALASEPDSGMLKKIAKEPRKRFFRKLRGESQLVEREAR